MDQLQPAHRDRGIDHVLAARIAAFLIGVEAARARVGAGQFLGQYDAAFHRHPRARGEVRGGGVDRIAEQDDAAIGPRPGLQHRRQRAIVDPVVARHVVADPAGIAAEIAQRAFQFIEQLVLCEEALTLDVRGQHPHVDAVGRAGGDAAGVGVAEVELALGQARRLADRDAPAALPGGYGRPHVREGKVAHAGGDAVGADHQIVMPRRAIRKRHVDPAVAVGQGIDRQAQAHRDRQFAHPRLHDPVQHRAHDPAGRGQAFLDDGFVQVLDMRAVVAEQAGAGGDRALRLHRLQQPQPAIGAQGWPGDRDPRAIDPPLRIEVDDLDRNPAFGQRNGRRHPADAAANDERLVDAADVLPCHGAMPIDLRAKGKSEASIGVHPYNRRDMPTQHP